MSPRHARRRHDDILLERIEPRILLDANPLALQALGLEALPETSPASVGPAASSGHAVHAPLAAEAPSPKPLLPNAAFETRLLAFPGAEGFGAFAQGGRGGDVYHVTTLADRGPGSLRDGIVSANGPRTIVFDVAGNIELQSRLWISQPYLTLAGQTAPGEGVTLQNHGLIVHDTHDIIIRYMRFRPGDNAPGEHDALAVVGSHDVMIDHVSASWSVDETLDTTRSTNVTVQWSIISEGLNDSNHAKGEHSAGLAHNGGAITLHHNLFAHNMFRNPIVRQDADLVNNVIYDWSKIGTMAGWAGQGEDPLGATRVNLQGNYYVAGPSTENLTRAYKGYPGSQLWASNNLVDSNLNGVLDGELNGYYSGYSVRESARFDFPEVHVDDPRVAFERVLREAGASLNRDAVDERIINQVATQTGSVIDSQNQVGGLPGLETGVSPPDGDRDGMPDFWEVRHALNPEDPSDGVGDFNFNGYSNLEEYLAFTGTQDIQLQIGAEVEVYMHEQAPFTFYSLHPSLNNGDDFLFTVDWDGDGRTDERFQGPLGLTVHHEFTKIGPQDIRVNAIDSVGRFTSTTTSINVVQPRTAIDFTVQGPTFTNVGQLTQFELGLPTNEFHSVVIDWNSDGVSDQTTRISDGGIVSHTFEEVGLPTVRFHVLDDLGGRTTQAHTLEVGNPRESPPVITGPEEAEVGQTVELVVDGEQHPSVDSSYEYAIDWDGDGRFEQTFTGGRHQKLSHQYDEPGEQIIQVAVTSHQGTTHTATHTLRVAPSIADTVLTIDGPSTTLLDQMALFTLDVSPHLDGQLYQYQVDWDGDGRTDELVDGLPGTQLQHVYTSAGPKTLTVSVENDRGQRVESTHAVEVVSHTPKLNIVGSPRIRLGDTAVFGVSTHTEGVIRGGKTTELEVDWDGDGVGDESHDLSTSTTLRHGFDTPGNYNVGFRLHVESGTPWQFFEVTVLQRIVRQPASFLVAIPHSPLDLTDESEFVTAHTPPTTSTWMGIGLGNRSNSEYAGVQLPSLIAAPR